MHLNFLEIGTSSFDTLLQVADEHTRGMSVEPIKHYLDSLPDKANVLKVNCAIKAKSRDDKCYVYYVPEDTINQKKLPSFLKGCNSINSYHLQHTALGITDLVCKDEITQMSIGELIEAYGITKIDFLKIDTEGGDCYILDDLYNLLVDNKFTCPNMIEFESNELSDHAHVDKVVANYTSIGYSLKHRGSDTVLVL